MKFCQNCGAQLEDDAVFCTSCGKTQEAVSNVDQNTYTYQEDSMPKKSKKGLIIGLSCGAAALIAIIVVLILVLTGRGCSTPEELAQKIVDAMNDASASDFQDCFYPGIMSDSMAKKYAKEISKEGKNVTCTLEKVEIIESYSDIESLIKIERETKNKYHVDISLNAVVKARLKVKYVGTYRGEYINETESERALMGEVDGEWYIIEP